MLHGVLEFLHTEDVHVQVVGTLSEVAVHDVHQRVGTLCVVVAECTRVDGLRVGDTVESVLVRQLSHRVERSEQAVLLCAVARVGTRRQRSLCRTSVRHHARSLAIDHVGGDRQDRAGRL